MELRNKPDFEQAMDRITAWYEQEILDRPPVRFTAHNADFKEAKVLEGRAWPDLKSKWFDAEFQLEYFIRSIEGQSFLAETFPIFWPNLGPEVYSAFLGSELEYQEVTSYSVPLVKEWDDLSRIRLDTGNEYFRKIMEFTELALEECDDNYLVGYTDLHPGIDCAAAFRDPQQLCIDFLLEPDRAKELIALSSRDFQKIYDHFDTLLKSNGQISVTWMGIPSYGKMHIPSCDFAALVGEEQFEGFILPVLQEEIKSMDHNIFHVDGKGVARNLDAILQLSEVNAIQWVQGVGKDKPIMQWVPLIKKCQAAGKSVVVDLQPDELEGFMEQVDPKGILLCIEAEEKIQPEIIKRVEKWRPVF